MSGQRSSAWRKVDQARPFYFANREHAAFSPQGCHLLSLVLEELGIRAVALHSHKPQKARLAALDRFKVCACACRV